jgi:predicted nucleotidyltransferase
MATHIYDIKEISKIVAAVSKSYGVKCVALFGSYARGNATEKSDIDLRIIDRGSLRGFFRLAGYQRELEEQFDIPVDVLTTGALSQDFLKHIEPEEVILYES